eukprot:510906-Amphidinium_carterae.1
MGTRVALGCKPCLLRCCLCIELAQLGPPPGQDRAAHWHMSAFSSKTHHFFVLHCVLDPGHFASIRE